MRGIQLALVGAFIGCGSGPPEGERVDAGLDAAAGPLLCGEVYCLSLGPPTPFVGLSTLAAIDVRGARVLAAAPLGDGEVREYDVDGLSIEPAGVTIELADQGGALAPAPRAIQFSPEGSVVLDGSPGAARLVFFRYDDAAQGGSLSGAVLDLVAEDVALEPSGMSLVTVGGQRLIALADASTAAPAVRFYDPAALRAAGAVSAAPLVASFTLESPGVVGSLFFWERVLALIQRDGEETILVLADLEASIESGVAVEVDRVSLSLAPAVVAMVELADARVLLAAADGSARIGALQSKP